MFADFRRFQGLDGDDADGDKYYGGSMYYGDGKGSGIAVRTWWAHTAPSPVACLVPTPAHWPPACRRTHRSPTSPSRARPSDARAWRRVRCRCGYRDCSPYEWRREEQDLEKTLW
jgi:hypothetical protein